MADKRGKQVAADEQWVPVRIPKAALERIDRWARKKDASRSWIIRRLVLEALEHGRDEGDGL